MEKPEYTIVIPVFNSESTLEELHERITHTFHTLKKSFETIYVEDGSHDNSWGVLKKIKEKNEGVTAIKLNKNFGQHNATFCGFTLAMGKYIITIDDDLQIPPEEIGKLIPALEEQDAEIVYGIYRDKKHSKARNMGSAYLKRSSKRWMDRPGNGSSFRLLTRELAGNIINHHQNFVFIDEILNWYTDNVIFVEVEHHPRKINKSGYSAFTLFRIVSNILIYYTTIPLKIMVYGGLITSVIFFLVSVYYILLKIFFPHVPLGYTSIIVGILFSTSLILFSLGIIGEYLRRIYMVQNKKPPYVIKKILK